MNRIRVKICGITRPADAAAAAAGGADAIGLIFFPDSPRAVTAAVAGDIVAGLPPYVTRVGVFVDATRETIDAVLGQVSLDLLQFHGDEDPADCAGIGLPYVKAIRMTPGVSLPEQVERYRGAAGLLLDTYSPDLAGGTGRTFDWDAVPPDLGLPLILAGGLTPANVSEALRRVRPYALDVSGGVESAKGIKDPAKIYEFMRQVRKFQDE